MELWELWKYDMNHVPIYAQNIHALFEASKKLILQDMAIFQDFLGFDFIIKRPELQYMFFPWELEAFNAQVIARPKQYAAMNIESMECLNVMVIAFCCLLCV